MKFIKVILYYIIVIFLLLELSLYTPLGLFLNVHENCLDGFNTKNIPTQAKLKINNKVKNENSEFKTDFITNNEGFRDEFFDTIKKKYRVITLGDSFTECVGSSNDSTWQKKKKKIVLDSSKKNIDVYNCGIAGNDPVFEYLLLKSKLIKYKPDLVIVTINASDITDIQIRGGLKRFNSKQELIIKQKPFWSFLLYSRLFRLISLVLCDYALNPLWKQKDEVSKANSIIKSAIDSTQILCKKHNCKLLVVFQPIQWDIDTGLEYKFKETIINCSKLNIDYIDVREEFRKMNVYIGCKKSRLDYVVSNALYPAKYDSTKIYGNQLYWKHDYHFKNAGYLLFAKSIYPKINKIINQHQ